MNFFGTTPGKCHYIVLKKNNSEENIQLDSKTLNAKTVHSTVYCNTVHVTVKL